MFDRNEDHLCGEVSVSQNVKEGIQPVVSIKQPEHHNNLSSEQMSTRYTTGFSAILMAEILSQKILIGAELIFFKSWSTLFSHSPSQMPSAKALNSASALLLDTTFCFLHLQANYVDHQ